MIRCQRVIIDDKNEYATVDCFLNEDSISSICLDSEIKSLNVKPYEVIMDNGDRICAVIDEGLLNKLCNRMYEIAV